MQLALLDFKWFVFQCTKFQCRGGSNGSGFQYTFQWFNDRTNGPRVTKFGSGVDLDDVWVDLENQGHRSKVTRSKKFYPHSAWAILDLCLSMQIEPFSVINDPLLFMGGTCTGHCQQLLTNVTYIVYLIFFFNRMRYNYFGQVH